MVIKRAVFTDLVLHLISVDLLKRAAHYCSSIKAFISAVLLFISAQISISSTHFLSINESCNLVFLETGDKICLRTENALTCFWNNFKPGSVFTWFNKEEIRAAPAYTMQREIHGGLCAQKSIMQLVYSSLPMTRCWFWSYFFIV